MHLLENHHPHHGIEFLGGPAIAVMIMSAQATRPAVPEESFAEKDPPMTHSGGFVVWVPNGTHGSMMLSCLWFFTWNMTLPLIYLKSRENNNKIDAK
jgi:hypothetical protein